MIIAIFDFFRRKKKGLKRFNENEEPNWQVTLADDPYAQKVQKAQMLKKSGKKELAEDLLRQIVGEEKKHVLAWHLLAELFMEIDEVGRALYCYERVVEYQPANSIAQDRVNHLQSVVRGRPDYLWEYNKERGLI